MSLEIRPVTPGTRAVFAAILEEANAWQKARGSEGWARPFDDAWMRPRLERGELFLACDAAGPVASLRLLWEDRPFWGARETGDSLYLHSFAVRRDRAGCGLGRAVIETVADRARARGRSRLRLDCFAANERLVAYYARNGFVPAGAVAVDGRTMALMERALGGGAGR